LKSTKSNQKWKLKDQQLTDRASSTIQILGVYYKCNSIKEEIKERIVLGTKAYYANLKFFKSRLVTKQSKLKLYRTVIRPIVTYASETWVLKEAIIQKLLVFERKILRRIFGPTKENQIWKVKTNEELDKLLKHKNIINHIKAQRLSWFGHIQRMPDTRTVEKIFN